MPTVRFYRLHNRDQDRVCTAQEVHHVFNALCAIGDQDRVMEGRISATSQAAPVNGARWAAVYRIRDDKLPSTADLAGVVADLNLAPGTNVAEGTHFTFREHAIVPVLSNPDGASVATISRYLVHASGLPVSLRQVIDPEVAAQLDELGEVGAATFEVDDLLPPPANGPATAIGNAIAHVRQGNRTQTANSIQVTLRWEGDERRGAAQGMRQWMASTLADIGLLGRVTKAKARGADDAGNSAPPVNLLDGDVAARVKIDREDPRRVLRTDAVAAIEEAYAQRADEIERAVEGEDRH